MDNQIDQDALETAILDRLSGPNWDLIKKGLAHEIYSSQAGALDASSWEKVNELRGFAKGIYYVMNLRETTLHGISEREQSNQADNHSSR